jgi:predicted nucleotidyltransferase
MSGLSSTTRCEDPGAFIIAWMIDLLAQHRPSVERLCRLHQVRRLDVFGSAARGGNFDPATSDFDFLVEFEPLGWQGFSNRYFGLLHGLEDLFKRDIDLVDVAAVRNPLVMDVATKTRERIFHAA